MTWEVTKIVVKHKIMKLNNQLSAENKTTKESVEKLLQVVALS